MEKPNYIDIFKDALLLTWRKKYLWWFGFFVLLSGLSTSFSNWSSQDNEQMGQRFLDFFAANQTLTLALVVVAVLFWLLLTALGIVSRGALIKSINAEQEKKPADFKQGWQAGRRYFWRVLSVGLVTGLAVLVLLIVLAVPIVFFFYNDYNVAGIILVILAAAIFLPVAFLSAFIRIYGEIYVVNAELSAWEALENAYALITKNLGRSIIVGLLLMVAGMALMMALLFALIPVAVAFALVGLIGYLILKKMGVMIVAVVAGVLLVGLFILASSVLQVFSQAVWVLFFRQIAAPKEPEVATTRVEEALVEPVANISQC